MMWNEWQSLFLPALGGTLLGAVFFGGLWWTVRRAFLSKPSALWFFGSLLLRTGIVLLGFYFLARGDWHRLIASLVGFLIARVMVTRGTRSAELATADAQALNDAS